MPEKQERPVWVWITSIFLLVLYGWFLLSLALIYGPLVPLSEAQKKYFESYGSVDIILTIVIGLINLIGAIFLFSLKRIAIYLFIAGLIVEALTLTWYVISRGLAAAARNLVSIEQIVIYAILIIVIAYSRGLIKRGVLT